MSDACARWAELVDREALGDPLAPSEAELVRLHPRSCAACRAEASLYGTLERFVDAPPAPDPAPDLAPRPETAPARPDPKRFVIATIAAAAIAAGLSFWIVRPKADVPAPPVAAAPAPTPMGSVVLTSGAGVEVDGRAVAVGQKLPKGSVVLARSGVACLALDPSVRACVARGTLLRVDEVGADRRLALLGGKIAAELDPQPAGTSFGITTREGSAIAVGTAFSVEVPPGDAPVVTRVMHGTVVVRASSGREQLVHAHEAASMTTAPTPLAATDESRDRALLDPNVAAEPADAAAPAPLAPPGPRASGEATETAATLLAAAREKRAHGDADGAAAAYRDLFARHPASVEAHTALVPWGEMLLGRGDATAALDAFDRYVAKGGPLVEEASFGRIRALRAVGRADDARTATEAFLARFPNGPLAATLTRSVTPDGVKKAPEER